MRAAQHGRRGLSLTTKCSCQCNALVYCVDGCDTVLLQAAAVTWLATSIGSAGDSKGPGTRKCVQKCAVGALARILMAVQWASDAAQGSSQAAASVATLRRR